MEPHRLFLAQGGQFGRRLSRFRLGSLQLLFQFFQGIGGALDGLQLRPTPLQILEHLLYCAAVLLLQPVDDVQPALQLV